MKHWMIFDFDGTVANSIEELFELINGMAPRYGYEPISREMFDQLRDLPLAKACRKLKVPLYKLGKVIPVILAEYRRIIPDLEPYPGIVPTLKQLNDMGISLGLISSNNTDNVRSFLAHHNISCFKWIEGTGGLLHKHNSIKRQIIKHGLQNEKVMYVGDEVRDIRAARKSNVQVISVTWGLHSAENLRNHKPDHLIGKPMEIVAIAKGFIGE
jgi:phosphoglycolate phosphatase